MRKVLDCGVLLAPGHEDDMREWVALHRGGLPRIRLHLVPLAPLAAAAQDAPAPAPPDPLRATPDTSQDVQALARLAVSLRRYDSCILPVAPSSVAWARMALSQAGALLTTPILLLMNGMKAPAIEDLLGLGAADFMAQPACLESMRVRLGRLGRPLLWRQALQAGVQEPPADYHAAGSGSAALRDAARPRVSADVLEDALAGVLEWDGYSRRSPRQDIRHDLRQDIRHDDRRNLRLNPQPDPQPDPRRDPRHPSAQESFRLAKARVVDGFERDYICRALSRHGGNVAQAARACAKHRRAFWALMQKHGIEAAPYRHAAHVRRLLG
ncbi:hypothetical protein [Achromobacter kerstersii]|uniref:hypothetical protein n=1 Tax=Achromobacter kerstersii TaxID=1353890 RepID=UPI00313DC335